MAKHFPRVREVGALKEEHFRAYLDAVEQSGVSARSWNDHLSIIRAIVRRVDARCKGFRDFLAERRKKPECTVHRNPYSPEELNAILATAAEIDPELHGPIVGAVCTALRKGDICRLRWSDIDMDGEWTSGAACFKGRVTVKTAKTGETISFPVLPPFRRVLEEAAAKRKAGVPYVWPRVALLYSREPSALDRRLRKILRAVGFAEPEQAEGKYPAPEDAEAAAILLEDGMEREGWTAKRRAKARRILALHFKGKNQKDIAGEIGTGKGAVCDYFKAMEDAGRMALVSPPKRETPGKPILAEVRDDEPRKRRASLCGWHSFRTTFCTLALECGVPMEILRKVTGHKTAEIVLRFYDRRGMESMVGAFAAMPQAIAGAAAPVAALPAKTAQDAEPLEGECVDVPQRLPSGLAALLDKATPEQLAQLSAVAEALMRGAGK